MTGCLGWGRFVICSVASYLGRMIDVHPLILINSTLREYKLCDSYLTENVFTKPVC
jgi:hypothetical protein